MGSLTPDRGLTRILLQGYELRSDRKHLQPLILGAVLHHDVLFQGIQPRHLCLYVVHHCLQRCPVTGLCLLMEMVDVHVVWYGHLIHNQVSVERRYRGQSERAEGAPLECQKLQMCAG